ncbi:DUF4145 domain-containing protein [Methylocystis sp. L43]|uniref:DUF4145 domain-containing protein n=1 Tax=unclassified Methylocystis TaxID=2625913 RepID=UPI0018C2D2B8|nr:MULTISPECIES: DUF4145 domain-containing protein [unclassified Methylocystis]MBG0799676.1 DUF4145 domain-containing protein [Methylocystis sp. L43]MBG0807459.1 DUF4145 domain-containing protein [Methylocystis sp. H15]
MKDDKQPEGAPIEELLSKAPHMKEFLDLLPAWYKESDRGMALIATSYLEDILRRAVADFLVDCKANRDLLEGFNAPLGTFSARIAAAVALGLISQKEAEEAHRLRKIRNILAHQVHVSFEDKGVKNICHTLGAVGLDEGEVDKNGQTRYGPRNDFSNSALKLINTLVNRFLRKKIRKVRLEPYRDE